MGGNDSSGLLEHCGLVFLVVSGVGVSTVVDLCFTCCFSLFEVFYLILFVGIFPSEFL